MRVRALASVIFVVGCNSSGSPSGGNPPGGGGASVDGGVGGIADASASDTTSASDAAVTALSTGAIVFSATLDGQADPDLYVLEGGVTKRLTQTTGGEMYPTISPDRTHIAFTRDFQLFTIDAAGRDEKLVAAKTGRDRLTQTYSGTVFSRTIGPAAWSPDGTQLAYLYPRDPMPNTDPTDPIDEAYATTAHVIGVDGSNDHLLGGGAIGGTVNSLDWSGTTISFSTADDCPDCAGGEFTGLINADGTNFRQLPYIWPSGHRTPSKHVDWSHDGVRWTFIVEVGSSYSGILRYESPGVLYASTANTDDATQLVSDSTSWNPRWSPDGSQIAFISSDGIYVIARTGGTPRRLLAATNVHGIDW